MARLFSFLLPFALLLSPLHAALTFPNIMDDNMVLQRAPQSAHVWGTSSPNSVVTLHLSPNLTLHTYSSSDGSFTFTLPPHPASTAPHHTLTVSDDSSNVTFTSVAFGDVFLCSGQSNMELGLNEAFHADETIAESGQYPDLRLFTINKTVSTVPLNDSLSRFPASLGSSWLPSSPLSTNGSYHDEVFTFYGYFSAVCYYSGRELYTRLGGNVPIGLIETCWSGTRIEVWMSPEALAKCPAEEEKEEELVEEVAVEKAVKVGAIPVPQGASVLWNGMWSAIVPFAITGVLWYQGESNAGSPAQYVCLQEAFILDLRERYHNSRLSFHFVLLAAFTPHSVGGSWPAFRAAQLSTLALPYTGYSSAIDLGDPTSPWGGVHSRYKLEVGLRMARSLLAVDYAQSELWQGPHPVDIVWPLPGSGVVLLRYGGVGENGGLHLNGTKACDDCCGEGGGAWMVVGGDGKMRPANRSRVLEREGVVLVEAEMPAGVGVVGVAHAWEQYPQCVLYNGEELPQIPFLAMRYSSSDSDTERE